VERTTPLSTNRNNTPAHDSFHGRELGIKDKSPTLPLPHPKPIVRKPNNFHQSASFQDLVKDPFTFLEEVTYSQNPGNFKDKPQ
jgi:hypothetical protein